MMPARVKAMKRAKEREKMQKPLKVMQKKVTQKPLKVKEKRVMMPARAKAKKNLQRTQKLEMHQLKMQHPLKVLMLLMLMLQQWKEQVGGQNSRLKLKHLNKWLSGVVKQWDDLAGGGGTEGEGDAPE